MGKSEPVAAPMAGRQTAEVADYVEKEPLPAAQVFEIGLVMAGAISAGTFTAGVIDFLVEALDAWEAAKQQERGKPPDQWSVPPHDIKLRVIAGASAGAMNAAIAAAALKYEFQHVPSGSPPIDGPIDNPFYRAWVQSIDIADLLKSKDLEGPDKKIVASALDSSTLTTITNAALDFTGKPRRRDYLHDRLRFILTQGSLRGIPYFLRMQGNAEASAGQYMRLHRSYRSFSANYHGGPSSRRPDDIPLPPANRSDDSAWQALGNAALGSGAFPVGLAARYQKRPYAELDYRYVRFPTPDGLEHAVRLSPAWRAPGMSPQDPYTEYVVDGGTMNNEPLDLARLELAGLAAENPRPGDEARRAVIMIDPFPDTLGNPLQDDSKTSGDILSVVQALAAAWKDQARFNPEDIILAANQNVYSRFLIVPSRQPSPGAAKDERKLKTPLASGALGGFAGFLHRDYRHHDYMLGRRNCQRFLEKHFTLHETNPLFDTWSPALRQAYLIQGGDDGSVRELPVIPLMDTVRREERLPDWPETPVDLDALEKGIDQRLVAVSKGLARTMNLTGYKSLLAGLGSWLLRKEIVRKGIVRIEKNLAEHELKTVGGAGNRPGGPPDDRPEA
jgi:hypothetical protein